MSNADTTERIAVVAYIRELSRRVKSLESQLDHTLVSNAIVGTLNDTADAIEKGAHRLPKDKW